MRKIGFAFLLLLLTAPAEAVIYAPSKDTALQPECSDVKAARKEIAAGLIFCSVPEFLKKDAAIAREYRHLKSKLTGTDRDMLVSVQGNWLSDRGDCYGSADKKACFSAVLDQRLAYLQGLRSDLSGLTVNPPLYHTVDVWYAQKFADQYAGKSIVLVGRMTDLDCDKDTPPPHARIADSSKPATIDVEFKALSDVDANLLCPKIRLRDWGGVPWEGELRRENGRLYFYMSAIFGRPLPYHDPHGAK